MSEKKETGKSKPTEKVTARARVLKGRGAKHVGGFVSFIRTQGVIGLAVGLVLGGAITIMVKSLIDNVVMPPIGLILGSSEGLKGLTISLGKSANGKDTILHYGVFLNDFINFLVIAAVIYLVVHMLGFDKIDKKKE